MNILFAEMFLSIRVSTSLRIFQLTRISSDFGTEKIPVVKPELLMYCSQTRKFGLGTRIARSNRLGKTFQDLSRISIPNCMIFVEILVFPSNPVHPAKFFSRVFSPNLFWSLSHSDRIIHCYMRKSMQIKFSK